MLLENFSNKTHLAILETFEDEELADIIESTDSKAWNVYKKYVVGSTKLGTFGGAVAGGIAGGTIGAAAGIASGALAYGVVKAGQAIKGMAKDAAERRKAAREKPAPKLITYNKFVKENARYLSPASHEEKIINKMHPTQVIPDAGDIDSNFNAGKNMKRDTSKDDHITSRGDQEADKENVNIPMGKEVKTRQGKRPADKVMNEDMADLEALYVDEVYTLIDEIKTLFEALEETGFSSAYDAKEYANNLKEIRDRLLSTVPALADPVSENLNEDYAAGETIKLKDGSTVKLSSKDAKAINEMLSGTKKRSSLENTMLKNQKEFKSLLTFARSLKEDLGEE